MKFSDKVAFSIGTGRCGTKFLYELLTHQPNVVSHHERLPMEDSFYRYAEWNSLPIDHTGYFQIKKNAIEEDLGTAQFSFESSAYLSLAVQPLYEYFNAKFIMLVRAPHAVVTSYYKKGWYKDSLFIEDYSKSPGLQPKMSLQHHSFSRIVPSGDELKNWMKLSRIGKLAWYYKSLNEKILAQLENLPSSQFMVIKLEDLDFNKYLDIADFLSFKNRLSENTFKKVTNKKVNTLSPSHKFYKWTDQEKEEFFEHTKDISGKLGYNYTPEYIEKLSQAPKSKLHSNSLLNKILKIR
ncbi:hypothetical protein JKA74_05705 [Marivirga sp. S37H4]|uniref:Sulfotransferase domain-containing protein n=1 Tax=Marivirga aurantiaca TaxID=2802615 RepID=A0A934WX85_9BACT|nr:sulfotransferase domain-containing protein [Marivirga aurantiaca]MBK6264526.1 hypothetical protein [Marivirga aurantiaca]